MSLPLLESAFCDRYKLIGRDKLMEYFALGQSMPGVISLNCGIFIGREIAGWPGALAAVMGCLVPAVCGMLFVTVFYVFIRQNPYVAGAISGIRVAAIAFILSTGIRMSNIGGGIFNTTVAAFALLAVLAWKWNIAVVIIGCGLIGVLRAAVRRAAGHSVR
jgi:chromate transporter